MRPDLRMFLIEPTQKKVLFLKHICSRLGLQDVEVIARSVEDTEGVCVDAAVTRALFSICDFIRKSSSVLKHPGELILSKGPKLKEELEELGEEDIRVANLMLPFEKTIRHLVVVRLP